MGVGRRRLLSVPGRRGGKVAIEGRKISCRGARSNSRVPRVLFDALAPPPRFFAPGIQWVRQDRRGHARIAPRAPAGVDRTGFSDRPEKQSDGWEWLFRRGHSLGPDFGRRISCGPRLSFRSHSRSASRGRPGSRPVEGMPRQDGMRGRQVRRRTHHRMLEVESKRTVPGVLGRDRRLRGEGGRQGRKATGSGSRRAPGGRARRAGARRVATRCVRRTCSQLTPERERGRLA